MPFTFKPDETGEAPAKHPDGSFVLEDTDHLGVWKVSSYVVNQFYTLFMKKGVEISFERKLLPNALRQSVMFDDTKQISTVGET